jgi:hypothetical protein
MKSNSAQLLRRTALALGCAAILLPATACRVARGSFDRTLQVSGPVILRVNTGSGNIHIMPGDPSSVRIVGHIHAVGLFHAQDRVRGVESNPPIQQSGNSISIGRNTPNNVSIGYDITLPPNTQLTAHSGSGDLRILNISGSTDASTGSGDIKADGLGGHVVLHSGSGDIHAGFNNSSVVNTQTGSGDITLKNVQGMLTAHTGSGDIEVSGTPSGGWNLRTGSGDVTLNTGAAHYSLNASTGSGSIHTNLPITTHGTLGHHHLLGDINGGGPTVQVATGSGDIRIH